MGVTELFNMSRFMNSLLQIPDLKVFILVYGEELAVSRCIFDCLLHLLTLSQNLFVCFVHSSSARSIILEEEQTPLDLSDWVFASIVPNGQRGGIALIIYSKPVKQLSYAIDPQVNPTSKQPLSDIEREDGDPIPSVSNLLGAIDYLLLYLKRPSELEKQKVFES